MAVMRIPISLLLYLPLVSACHNGPAEHHAAEGALGPYSAAVTSGDLVFLSGKIGESGDFAHEAETSLDRVEAELEKLGLTFADVVEARIFLVDMERYDEFNEIYARRLSAPYPARACVAVAALPRGAQVEIQMVAHRR